MKWYIQTIINYVLFFTALNIAAAQDSVIPADCPAVKNPAMKWAVESPSGQLFSKDPSVVRFNGKYYMYFSLPGHQVPKVSYGWHVGIAQSEDLTHWESVGEVIPLCDGCKKGLAAPCARVWDNKVHLFFQSYGNGAGDAIYYAVSPDGVNFKMAFDKPIFSPQGDWSNGRAIDADFIEYNGKCYLFAATRDPKGKIQKQCLAIAKNRNDLAPDKWTCVDHAILEPTLSWEGDCIEAATTIVRPDGLYMFYAGNYNCAPQKIGLAKSKDGIHWNRVWAIPFMTNGSAGQWNSSESGHPCIFYDDSTKKYWLFYQGSPDKGKSWFLSRVELDWSEETPRLKNEL